MIHAFLSPSRPVRLALATLVCATTACAAKIEVSTVFEYGNSDPYDRANLYGFNHAPNVTVAPDGSLIAAWFSGAHEGDIHQLILQAKSADGGKSWSAATPLVDIPRKSDFDAAFLVKGNRTWMLFAAGRWNRYPWVGERAAEKAQVGLDSYRLHVVQSDDSGRTWSDPVVTIDRRGFSCKNGIVLRDGRMLFPVYDDSGGGKWATSMLRSADDGKTWQWVGQVLAGEGKAGGEPAVVELDNGEILTALRSRDGHIWFAQSKDAGDKWGVPYAGEFDAAISSQALFRTKAGQVLLAYNNCKPPARTPLALRVLDQKTMKWGEPIDIAHAPAPGKDVWSSQVSYPSITELSDGRLVVVWTEISLAPQAQSGKIRAARIKL